MKIRKAVITAAGYGTRFFPVTKTIQKEMISILNRPLVDYVVEDCLKAGIEEIIFVVKETDTQIRHFYSESQEIKAYLERMNKLDKYPELEKLHTKAKYTFVIQRPSDPYGTATPLKLVKEHVYDEEAFLMFMGDDFIYNRDDSSEAEKMIKHFEISKAKALATFVPRPDELLHKYGIARVRKDADYEYLIDIVEKPEPGTAPSNLSNISKYIFTSEIFEVLENQQLNLEHNELFITDTVTAFAQNNPVVAYATQGEFIDSGFVEGWLKANLLIASRDKEMFEDLRNYINSL